MITHSICAANGGFEVFCVQRHSIHYMFYYKKTVEYLRAVVVNCKPHTAFGMRNWYGYGIGCTLQINFIIKIL